MKLIPSLQSQCTTAEQLSDDRPRFSFTTVQLRNSLRLLSRCWASKLNSMLLFDPCGSAVAVWVHFNDAQLTVVLEEAAIAGARLPHVSMMSASH